MNGFSFSGDLKAYHCQGFEFCDVGSFDVEHRTALVAVDFSTVAVDAFVIPWTVH